MRKLFASLLLVPLTATIANAQTGDPQKGKELWESNGTQCRNCHGPKGQGAFGPDLAGRKLTINQFKQALRKPWGVMPAYVDSQISDSDAGDLLAYFDSLPVNDQPGKWRFEVPANAPRGQVTLLTMGCGQCHGPVLDGPRTNVGAVDGDYDLFKDLVYHHTDALAKFSAMLGEKPPPRLRMGNFNPNRLWETQLHDIYDWARNEAGWRARIVTRLGKGATADNGVTYKLDVENAALPGKGVTAEGLSIRLIVPNGATVAATTGDGYQGTQTDEKSKATVAVWNLPRMAPKDHQSYTITLSKAATAADNLRGEIRWTKPVMKAEEFDQNPIAPAPM